MSYLIQVFAIIRAFICTLKYFEQKNVGLTCNFLVLKKNLFLKYTQGTRALARGISIKSVIKAPINST